MPGNGHHPARGTLHAVEASADGSSRLGRRQNREIMSTVLVTDYGAVLAYTAAVLLFGIVVGWYGASLCMISKCCDCRESRRRHEDL